MKPAPILGGLVAGLLILAGIWYFDQREPAVAPAAVPAPAPAAVPASAPATAPAPTAAVPEPAPTKPEPTPDQPPKPAPVAHERPHELEVRKTAPAAIPSGPALSVPVPAVAANPQPPAQPPQLAPPQSQLQPAPPPSSAPVERKPVLKRIETPRPPLTIEDTPPSSRSATPRLYKRAYSGPSSGNLKYSGPAVIQNGEIVFRNLPDANLRLFYDRNAWDGRLSPDDDGSQKLVMRSLKPGSQRKCEVKWEVSGH